MKWGKYGNIEVVAENPVEYIKKLKKKGDGKMVVWGSLTLAQSLLKKNMFDEVHLFTVPIAIGKGYGVFPEDMKATLMNLKKQQKISADETLSIFEPGKIIR